MGLLDAILGGVLNAGGPMRGPYGDSPGGMFGGSQAQGANPLLMMALQLLQQNGGIEGILSRFQQAGYGQQAQSWVGTGPNMPINADALQQIFGSGALSQVAQQLGMSHDQALDGVAQTLPQVVDQMTPTGQVTDDNNDLVNQALAILQSRRGG